MRAWARSAGMKRVAVVVWIINIVVALVNIVLWPPSADRASFTDASLDRVAAAMKDVEAVRDHPLRLIRMEPAYAATLDECASEVKRYLADAQDDGDDDAVGRARSAAETCSHTAQRGGRSMLWTTLLVLGGLLFGSLGIFMLAAGLPKNGTLLTLIGAAAPLLNNGDFQFIVPTAHLAVAWIVLLVMFARSD